MIVREKVVMPYKKNHMCSYYMIDIVSQSDKQSTIYRYEYSDRNPV